MREKSIEFEEVNKMCDIEYVTYFNFSGSRIKHLKSSTFSRMSMRKTDEGYSSYMLPSLDLSNTGLVKIDKNSLSRMKERLKILYIQQNQLKEFPDEICQLTNLQSLIMDQNFISHNSYSLKLPQNCKLRQVTSLSISSNHISAISDDLCSVFPNTEFLNLRDNGPNFNGLENLQRCYRLNTVYWPNSWFSCSCDLFRKLKFSLVGPVDTKSSHYVFRRSSLTHATEDLKCDPLDSAVDNFPEGTRLYNDLQITNQVFCSKVLLTSANFILIIITILSFNNLLFA
ncbi:uncharacterized protein LOC142340001 isoform X2 [Convolutriloba macropyga]